jgi:hypothetical protein
MGVATPIYNHLLVIMPGFLTAILIVVASFTGDAAVANAIVDILSTFLPIFNEFWTQSLFFILLFFGFGFVNIVGLKKGVGFCESYYAAEISSFILNHHFWIFGS